MVMKNRGIHRFCCITWLLLQLLWPSVVVLLIACASATRSSPGCRGKVLAGSAVQGAVPRGPGW